MGSNTSSSRGGTCFPGGSSGNSLSSGINSCNDIPNIKGSSDYSSGISGSSNSISNSRSSSSSSSCEGKHSNSGSSNAPRSPSPNLQAASGNLQRDLLLGAFKKLSLQDRVALSIGLESRSSDKPSSPEQAYHDDDQMTDSGSEYFSDTSSMVSDADVVDAIGEIWGQILFMPPCQQ